MAARSYTRRHGITIVIERDFGFALPGLISNH